MIMNNRFVFETVCIILRRSFSNISGNINFQQVLNEQNLKRCVRKLNKIKVLKGLESSKNAAVLIPLCHIDNELSLLYTLRTHTLTRNQGQISFPGGMQDIGETLQDTAVRETEEEVGIRKETIKVYGSGSPIPRNNVLITPVVGYVGHIDPQLLAINKQEVQSAFGIPLYKFCDLNSCHYTCYTTGYAIPVFFIDNYRIWGVTAYITHIFLKGLLNEKYEFNIDDF